MKKHLKMLIPIVFVLIIAVVIIYSLNRATPEKVVGTWRSTKEVFNNTMLLEINSDGTFTENILNAQTGTPINDDRLGNKGTWTLHGNSLELDFYDLELSATKPAAREYWKLSFGKMKNGAWVLEAIGR